MLVICPDTSDPVRVGPVGFGGEDWRCLGFQLISDGPSARVGNVWGRGSGAPHHGRPVSVGDGHDGRLLLSHLCAPTYDYHDITR